MAVAHLAFGPFQMDLAEGRLRRGGHPVALPPRDFAVLRHLVLRPGQLVSADDLLDSVWADTFVVRGVVKVAIYRIRAALGDDSASSSCIETIGRQGYRFVGEVRSEPGLGSPVALPSTSEPAAPPARREELDRLRSSFEKAILGRLQFAFVNGEDARQLSDLISSFVAELERESAPWCARARCAPQLGASEPYRPALEALQQLCRGPLSSEVVAILRRHAPLWLAELPGSVAPGKRESLPRAPAGARPERMQREFCEAALALASLRPLVLVLEDAQRSDPATLDLLWSLAARPGTARILVLATRGPDKSAASHAQLAALETELVARGIAVQLELARRGSTAPAKAPFVGRSDELPKLAGWLDRVRGGTGRIGLITGEAGIGKTRLLEEFAAHARASGAEVLWGRCYEGDLARPFGAIAEAIAAYASESPEARLRQEVREFGGIVAKIAPELRERLPELATPSALSPGEERSRQLDAVVQLLWAIARRAPLVLVLDDLHWADPPTILLLRHAARFLRRHRVLILGAHREVELSPDHPMRAAQLELSRSADFESMSRPRASSTH